MDNSHVECIKLPLPVVSSCTGQTKICKYRLASYCIAGKMIGSHLGRTDLCWPSGSRCAWPMSWSWCNASMDFPSDIASGCCVFCLICLWCRPACQKTMPNSDSLRFRCTHTHTRYIWSRIFGCHDYIHDEWRSFYIVAIEIDVHTVLAILAWHKRHAKLVLD